jgi:hypothetical protein
MSDVQFGSSGLHRAETVRPQAARRRRFAHRVRGQRVSHNQSPPGSARPIAPVGRLAFANARKVSRGTNATHLEMAAICPRSATPSPPSGSHRSRRREGGPVREPPQREAPRAPMARSIGPPINGAPSSAAPASARTSRGRPLSGQSHGGCGIADLDPTVPPLDVRCSGGLA